MELDEAYDLFCEAARGSGLTGYGPFWEHCLGYWKANLAMLDKVVFLGYEEIKEDAVRVMRKLEEFLGVPFSQEAKSVGVPEEGGVALQV